MGYIGGALKIVMRSYTQNDIEAKVIEFIKIIKISKITPKIRIPNNINRADVERGEVCLDIY